MTTNIKSTMIILRSAMIGLTKKFKGMSSEFRNSFKDFKNFLLAERLKMKFQFMFLFNSAVDFTGSFLFQLNLKIRCV